MPEVFKNLPTKVAEEIARVPTFADLPTGVEESAVRWVDDEGTIYGYHNGTWVPVGSGVVGPIPGAGSTTVDAVVRWATTDGDEIKNSPVLIDDSGNVTGVDDLSGVTAQFTGTVTANAFEAGGFDGTEKALYSTAANLVEQSATTRTELEYLQGVTSNVQDQLDDKVEQTDFDNHVNDTTTHGTTGAIVGTSDSQTLTNKTIDADLNTVSNIDDGNIKAGAGIDAAKIADGSVSSTEFQYLSGVTSDVQTQLNDKIDDSEKGANNGVATLDAGGKVPVSQLPASVFTYEGTWAASTNTPTLTNGTGDAGMIYVASDAGTVDFGAGNITFAAGDWVMYNGTVWEKSINSNAVASVNGQTGVVVIGAEELDGSLITTTELNRLAGVTSDIQDQLDDKVNGAGTVVNEAVVVFDGTTGVDVKETPVSINASGDITGVQSLDMSAGITGVTTIAAQTSIEVASFAGDFALVSDINGVITESPITSTELGYLTGTTSDIQTQIDNKLEVVQSPVDRSVAIFDAVNEELFDTNVIIPIGGNDLQVPGDITGTNIGATLLTASDGLELTDLGATATPAANTGSDKLINREGALWLVDDAGNETQVGGGSGEINVIGHPSTASSWGTSSATIATTTTAAELPLGPLVPTAIELSSSTNGGYARYRWTMPEALKQRKLKAEWYQLGSGGASGDYKVEIYKNSASNYSGSYTEFNLSTDSSGDSPIPNLDGKYTTTFDSDDGDYYEIRFVRTAASASTIYLANVIVGPGIQPQGAVVTDEVGWTPTVGGVTGGSPTVTGKYRRIGNRLHAQIFVDWTTVFTGGSGPTFSLPSGLTIDTAAFPSTPAATVTKLGDGYIRDVGTRNYQGIVLYTSTTEVLLRYLIDDQGGGTDAISDASITTTAPFTWVNGDDMFLEFSVPVAEWAGAGTVNLVQNDVEYAWNSDTTDVNDTTSFAYGPNGVAIGSYTGTRSKTVRFQTPIGPTDFVQLQIRDTSSSSSSWIPFSDIAPYSTQSGTSYGGRLIITSTPTDVIVRFQSGGYVGNNATYGGAGAAWSGLSTYNWRVIKIRSGNAVGFGLASISQTGLAYGFSYIHDLSASSMANNTDTDLGASTLALAAGVYLVEYGAQANIVNTVASTIISCSLTITDTSNVTVEAGHTWGGLVERSSGPTYTTTGSFTRQITLASATTIKLRGTINVTGGTVTSRNMNFGYIKATRVAG